MKRIAMILLGVLSIPAYGGIASVEYTDSKIDEVSKAIDSKADKTGYAANMLLQTANDGTLTATTLKTGMIENGAVTNSKLASGIGLDKLDMGTLPASGKHILIWNSGTNKYVFEKFVVPLQCSAGTYDIGFEQCVDPSVRGDDYGFRNDSTGAYGPASSKTDKYGLTTDQTWAVEFSGYGVVKGTALCSSTPKPSTGGSYPTGTPDESGSGDTRYCWCKMTEPSVSRLVFYYDDGVAADCANICAYACARSVLNNSDFRSGMFGSVGK